MHFKDFSISIFTRGYEKSSFRTSSKVGMEEDAPFFETVIDDAIVAISRASLIDFPFATELIKKPVKVSPAAVVSTTSAGTIG